MCPECHGDDIEAIDQETRRTQVKMGCNECGHEWWEDIDPDGN